MGVNRAASAIPFVIDINPLDVLVLLLATSLDGDESPPKIVLAAPLSQCRALNTVADCGW